MFTPLKRHWYVTFETEAVPILTDRLVSSIKRSRGITSRVVPPGLRATENVGLTISLVSATRSPLASVAFSL